MTNRELAELLRQIKVEAGSLMCLDCGYERSCGVHGCNIMHMAADALGNSSRHVEALQKEIEGLRAKLPRWIPVTERLPEDADPVLARGCAVNNPKRTAMFKGRWIAAHSMLAADFGCDDDMALEYDEAIDEYYVPEGWFERIENWDDYTDIAVGDYIVTHWMPLPEGP